MELQYFYDIFILILIFLFGLLFFISIINRITTFLLKYKINKTFMLLLHIFLICVSFGIIYSYFEKYTSNKHIYVISAIIIGPIIGASSNMIIPYIRNLTILNKPLIPFF